MANMIINISTAHPVLVITVILGFIATCLTYIATDFVSDYMVISGDLTAGTFFGTFTHMNWGHYLSNMLFLIPVWIYADNKVGKVFVVSIVLANMIITGIYGLISGARLCGLSGVVYMLLGLMCILGNWLMFIFAGVLFVAEFTLLNSEDETSHASHVVFFVVGIIIALVKIWFSAR